MICGAAALRASQSTFLFPEARSASERKRKRARDYSLLPSASLPFSLTKYLPSFSFHLPRSSPPHHHSYIAWYNKTLHDLLDKGIVDDDQPLMMACAMDRPDLCRIHPGYFLSESFDRIATATSLTKWLTQRYVIVQSPRESMFC